jgi:hypothetical protein
MPGVEVAWLRRGMHQNYALASEAIGESGITFVAL